MTFSNEIAGFFKEYRFLSNFYYSPQYSGGYRWPTNEHYYQFCKAYQGLDYWRNEILNADVSMAKRIGRQIPLRPDWDEVKDDVMMTGLWAKFRNPHLQHLLIKTDPLFLVEENYWGDTYWGRYKGVGLNRLGEMLMQIRDTLIWMQSISIW